jgi:hypothetical protein
VTAACCSKSSDPNHLSGDAERDVMRWMDDQLRSTGVFEV